MNKKFYKYSLGFDLGGTKLAAALLRQDGKIIEFLQMPVHLNQIKSPQAEQKRIVKMIVEIATDLRTQYPLEFSTSHFSGIGLVSAGPLNVTTGTLLNPKNFPNWKMVPLKKRVEKELKEKGFKTPFFFQNDAMGAAFAEAWVGGAQKLHSFCVVTVGTGIGTGVIVNGLPCQTSGMGSEFGHMVVDYKSGESVEQLASGTAIVKRARKLGFKGHSVEELLNEKNKKYTSLFADMAEALAVLCFNLTIGFNLEKIVFSGGLVKAKKHYFSQTQKHFRKMMKHFNSHYKCSLEIAQTQTHAGVIGAGSMPFFKKEN